MKRALAVIALVTPAARPRLTTAAVTTRDYFHPSVWRQAKAAAAIWAAFP